MLDKRPNTDTYWVNPHFLAGEYPGSQDPDAAREKIDTYLDAGVTFFIDLTEEGELEPYAHFLRGNPHNGIVHKRMSIRDHNVPAAQKMTQILDTIDEAIAGGHTVYVHCWGGIGRTGTVVGCYLVRHGMTGDEALAQIAEHWKDVEKSWRHPHSPETDVQVEMVRGWGE